MAQMPSYRSNKYQKVDIPYSNKKYCIYSSVMWTVKVRTDQLMNGTEMDFWRRSAGRETG